MDNVRRRTRAADHSLRRSSRRLKPAKYHYVALRRSVLRMQPAAFLALSAVTLGALAPLLPTSFIAGALLMSGVALAVYGAGANHRRRRVDLPHRQSRHRPSRLAPSPSSTSEIELARQEPQHRR